MKKMIVTCGVIVTDGQRMLICHPTHGRNWDIPKGRKDPGEEDIDTAVRELREETGILADPELMIYLGEHDYKRNKRLVLFRYDVENMPDPALLICTSTFEMHGKRFPEMDAFVVTTKEVAVEKVNPDLARIINSIELR
jgi:putative (di)nucleoside polyphosphate hydrolase